MPIRACLGIWRPTCTRLKLFCWMRERRLGWLRGSLWSFRRRMVLWWRIAPGYRGEIKVVMTNLSATVVEIKAGDRIAQLRIVRRIEAEFEVVSELVEAPRGAKGFG